jgi:type II secretion system protein L
MPTILRVLTGGAIDAAKETPWALFDGDRLVRSGRGGASAWPDAGTREAVLAASAVRLVHVALPQMPADRLTQAVAFALEDQLAGPADGQHLAHSKRDGDGVDVAIVARSLLAPLAKSFDRVVAEPALAPKPAAGVWRWYRSGTSGGFVRRHDGSAFATGPAEAGGPLPADLALPLRHAARGTEPLTRIEASFDADDAQLRAWSEEAGLAFERAKPWRWEQDGAALAGAFDLLQGEYSRTPRAAPTSLRTGLRWAVGLAIAALAIHVAGTLASWGSLRYRAWDAQRDIVATARTAGVADATDAQQAAAALAQRHAEARHRAGLPANSDALPLLARAAPSLSLLPPGALKSATYTASTWTFDLGKLDPAVAAAVDRDLAAAGLPTLMATTPAGTRMRIGP